MAAQMLVPGVLLCAALAAAAPFAGVPSVPLHNAADPGMMMPIIGIGTGGYARTDNTNGEVWNNSVAEAAVLDFLNAGGRRIDTSLLYMTQEGVGAAVAKSGLKREELFITSKCDSPTYGMIPGGYNETMKSIDVTLQQLGVPYVDLMLIHWPGRATRPSNPPPCLIDNDWRACRNETWRALEDARAAKKVKAIGVSNFEPNHVQEIINLGRSIPAVDQFEYHPYWHTDDLVTYLKAHDIQPNGYSPLGAPDHMAFHKDKMPVLLPNNAQVQAIAKAIGKTPGQTILRWEYQNGFVLNPRTKNPQHMADNMNIFDFELSASQMAQLAKIDTPPENVCGDPRQIP